MQKCSQFTEVACHCQINKSFDSCLVWNSFALWQEEDEFGSTRVAGGEIADAPLAKKKLVSILSSYQNWEGKQAFQESMFVRQRVSLNGGCAFRAKLFRQIDKQARHRRLSHNTTLRSHSA